MILLGKTGPVANLYTITQLANEFGVTPRAIRFYEDKGLLSPARRGQARVFNNRDRARLILILRGKRFGFSLQDIRELLNLYDRPDGGLEQLRATVAKARERTAVMTAQRDDLSKVISELEERIREGEDKLGELEDATKESASAAE